MADKSDGQRYQIRKRTGGPLGTMWDVIDTHDRGAAVISCGGEHARTRAALYCTNKNTEHRAALAKAGGR